MKGQPQASTTAHVDTRLSVEDKLKFAIINGEKAVGEAQKLSLEELLEEALKQYTPLDLIDTILLDAMRTVGDLFGARKMQLSSVLDSAGVIKRASPILSGR